MNLLTAGILAYVGSQVYQSLKRKAFTLTVAVPRGWVEVDEGMFRASRSDRAFVILHKTPEEVLAESQHYQAVSHHYRARWYRRMTIPLSISTLTRRTIRATSLVSAT